MRFESYSEPLISHRRLFDERHFHSLETNFLFPGQEILLPSFSFHPRRNIQYLVDTHMTLFN